MTELAERVAVLESRQGTIEETMKKIAEKQDRILSELTKYKGAFGMLTMLGSAIVAVAALMKDKIASWMN